MKKTIEKAQDAAFTAFYWAKYLVIGAVLVVVFGLLHYQYISAENITVSVKDINKGDYVSLCIESEGTQDCNEYENIDDLLWLKWDSGTVRSNLAAAMTDQTPITIKVHGYRIEWLSWRKNIVKVVE